MSTSKGYVKCVPVKAHWGVYVYPHSLITSCPYENI